jgi:hypothetical protein
MSVNRKVSVCVANSLRLSSEVDAEQAEREVTGPLKRPHR